MKRLAFLLLVSTLGLSAFAGTPVLNYKRLNAQAAREYNVPVRPGYEGRNPFWNGFSCKFIYAPAFGFPAVEGAVSYRYTLTTKAGDRSWSFTADKPDRPLSKVWKDVPPGDVVLTVQGLDKTGAPVGEPATRSFFRDFPFTGPYPEPVIPYREAALKTMRQVHNAPWIQAWLTQDEPDMAFKHYTYANKTIGGVINVECLVARNIPSLREEAIAIAKKAAGFIMGLAQGPDQPLAYLPPTYYKGLVASAKKENQGRTMALDALAVATALLNLYDVCGEKAYFDRAVAMAGTYRRLQRPDGSFPVKLDYATGEAFTDADAMLHPVVRFYTRLERQYGVTEFHDVLERAEAWMRDVALERSSCEVRVAPFRLKQSVLDKLILDSAVRAHLARRRIAAMESHECIGQFVIEFALDALVIHALRHGVVDVEQRYRVLGYACSDVFRKSSVDIYFTGYRDAAARKS